MRQGFRPPNASEIKSGAVYLNLNHERPERRIPPSILKCSTLKYFLFQLRLPLGRSVNAMVGIACFRLLWLAVPLVAGYETVVSTITGEFFNLTLTSLSPSGPYTYSTWSGSLPSYSTVAITSIARQTSAVSPIKIASSQIVMMGFIFAILTCFTFLPFRPK